MATKQLCALKVRIGLHEHNGHAKYPDFGSLPCVKESGMDWAHYIDTKGTGWAYDKCGHREHSEDSPYGQQWGMLLIPPEFCEQACAAFPDDCQHISEEDASTFWETKAHGHLPEVSHNADTLAGIKAEIQLLQTIIAASDDVDEQKALGEQLTAAIERAKAAVDPDHDHPGVTRNKQKCWQHHKTNCCLELIEPK